MNSAGPATQQVLPGRTDCADRVQSDFPDRAGRSVRGTVQPARKRYGSPLGKPTQRIAIMMSKKLLAGFAGAMAMSLTFPAMAEEVTNTVTVEPTVSIEAADTAVALVLDGSQGAENYDTFGSALNHLNNVEADISVAVDATDLPEDLVYWLFRDKTEAEAITEIEGDAAHSTVDGIFRYSGGDVNTGVPTTVFATVVANSAATALPVVYAADARNSLPPPADHTTTVTWTIAPTP